MNSGLVDGPDDYYGLTNLKPIQNKKVRKMKRTQLSNEKKSNQSHKNFSNQKDSHLSNLKSKKSTYNNSSVLKIQQNSSYKNSLLGNNENNLPSCTEIHSVNNFSTRKNRLQINTGVVGIKMQSVSPTHMLSQPSKVLFVNQSTSGKKGSKSKKQKSILYVEYNNFMTQFNNNKNQNKANVSGGKNQQNYMKNNNDYGQNRKQVNSKKNIKTQVIDNDNEYFIGMKQQCLSPVQNKVQKIQKQQKNSPYNLKNIQTSKGKISKYLGTPNKNQTSVGNLSVSSAMGDNFQSPKLFSNSPNTLKNEPVKIIQKQQLKSKVLIKSQSKTQQKTAANQKAKVSFLQNFNLRSSHQNLKQKQMTSLKQQLQKKQILSSQKDLQPTNQIPLKKYSTQKQIQKEEKQQKVVSQKNIQISLNLINPYSLKRDQNLVTNYQKKKVVIPFQHSSKQNMNSQSLVVKGFFSDKKAKQSTLKTQQDQNFSVVSESALSQTSSKNGRRLLKLNGLSPNSKILLKKSQSKIKLPEAEKINVFNKNDEQKSNQNYYRPRISVHQLLKNSQNQSQVSDANSDSKFSKINKNGFKLSRSRQIEKTQQQQTKRFQDYKTDYLTPNPYSHKHLPSSSRISKKNNDSEIGSDLESNISQFEKLQNESQASQISQINDQTSLKSGKSKFLTSSSRLKRQELIRKSNLRSSRNSQKSIKSNISKKISINPKKSSQYQIIIQEPKNLNRKKSDFNNKKDQISQKNSSKMSSEQSNQSFTSRPQNEPSIVKFMDQKQRSHVQEMKSSKNIHSNTPKKVSIHSSQYKNELVVQNIESQIQPYEHSKIQDIKNDNLQRKNVSNRKPQIQESQDLSQSNHSSRLLSSMKRSGLRKSIKKSMHHSGVHLRSSMQASKNPISNLLVKSGKDLKPLTAGNAKIQDFLSYIDEYQITIGFLYLYVQNTQAFYCKENEQRVAPETERFLDKIKNQKMQKYEEKYQRLSFLVLKKYFYQKNRLIKCLRGLQSNVFKLTGLQVPDQILKKFLPHEQTKQKLKQIELQVRQLFKQLDEKFKALRSKRDNKKDKLIKIQAPYDNFSRDIVQNLVQQLNELTAEIDQLDIDTASSNPSIPLKRSKHFQSLTSVIAQELFTSQERGVEVMQLVFLISELQSRKTKKVELFNISDIDFQVYYEKYIDKLLETYQFFESIKYPSDELEKKTGK